MDTEYTKAFKAGYDFGYKDAANENRYNTGVKVGIAYEHDRITELLENYIATYYKLSPNSDAIKYPIENIIALIKGKA